MQSQQSRVLVQLREMIMKGEFSPGERLAEIPIAEKLSASRTPIRLAFATLEQEGLIQSSPSGGYVMRVFTRKELDDAIAVRGVLEGMAARLLAENGLTRSMSEQFWECVREGDEALKDPEFTTDGYARYVEMNNRFHELLIQFTDNMALIRAIELNNRLPFAAASATLPMHASTGDGRQWLMITHNQHRSLVTAMEKREGTRAQAIAIEHVEVARMNLRHAFRTHEGVTVGQSRETLNPA
jgi:GntR family transcriptional regulator, vanillate catabolism transcriptional regulator